MPVMATLPPCMLHHPYYVAFLFPLVDSWLQEGASVSNSRSKKEKAHAQKEPAQKDS